MIDLKLTVPKLPRLDVEHDYFTAAQMRRLGDKIVEAIAARTLEARNAYDQPMAPLSERYKRHKIRKGRAGVRDLRLTGRMMAALETTEATARRARVEFRSAEARKKAHFRQLADRFFGISPNDGRTIDLLLEELHVEATRAWVRAAAAA